VNPSAMASNNEHTLDPALIALLDPFEYDPDNADLLSYQRLVDYVQFERMSPMGDRAMPPGYTFIATVRKVPSRSTLWGLDPSNGRYADHLEYIVTNEHGSSSMCYRQGTLDNLIRKITGILTEGTRELLEDDEPGAGYYQ